MGSRERDVIQPRDTRLVRHQHVDAFAPSAEKVERVRLLDCHVHEPSIPIGTVRQALQPAGGEIEMQDGLGVGVDACRSIGGACQPAYRFGHEVGSRIVIRERGRQFVEPVRSLLFEGTRGAKVDLTTATREETVIGDVLGKGVLEYVQRFVASRPFEQKLLSTQLVELARQRPWARPHPLEQTERHFASDDRCGLQQLLRKIREAIHPRHDHTVNGFGNRVRRRPVLDDGARELLEKKRIAFAAAQNRAGDVGVQGAITGDRRHQPPAIGGRERRERDLRRVRSIHPRRRVAGPVGGHE